MLCCVCYLFVFLFFFMQKTAYEMRISDCSSHVCSSDLRECLVFGPGQGGKQGDPGLAASSRPLGFPNMVRVRTGAARAILFRLSRPGSACFVFLPGDRTSVG